MEFKEKLARLLKKVGQPGDEALARKLGCVSDSTVRRWREEGAWPRLNAAFRLARYLGVTTDYLADDDAEEPEERPLLTEDERLVLKQYRLLKGFGRLDADRAVVGLASAARPQGQRLALDNTGGEGSKHRSHDQGDAPSGGAG